MLKDASAASIYGARASNGVVIIETTKRGSSGPPKTTVRVRSGVASPTRGYDDILFTDANSLLPGLQAELRERRPGSPDQHLRVREQSNDSEVHLGRTTAGQTRRRASARTSTRRKYAYPDNLIMASSAGTDWWKEVFGPAYVGDYNVDVAGGSQDNAYLVSANYFDQNGTAKYNRFQRGSLRVNTNFQRRKWSFGENLAVSTDRHNGGLPDDPGGYAEDGILGKNILMQPIVPVRRHRRQLRRRARRSASATRAIRSSTPSPTRTT